MRDDVRLSLAGRMHMFIVTGWVIPLYGGYIIGSKTNYDKHILHVSLKNKILAIIVFFLIISGVLWHSPGGRSFTGNNEYVYPWYKFQNL